MALQAGASTHRKVLEKARAQGLALQSGLRWAPGQQVTDELSTKKNELAPTVRGT